MLDAITGAAAFVRNGRMDILGANSLGRAFYAPLLESPYGPANTARFCFLDPSARGFYADWEKVATDAAAILRSEAGRDPYDRDLSDLVGELSTRSEEFRVRWAAHDVSYHDSGVKRFHHPLVGDRTLSFETMSLTADPTLTVFVFTAEPGSKSAEALSLLASWATPLDTADASSASDRG
jgi:MmyB-like transcription regulator ligand binding domain